MQDKIELKIYESVGVSIAQIAKVLAKSNSQQQALFFDEFGKALKKQCGDSNHFMGMQMIDIAKFLKEEGEQFATELALFIAMKNNEK